MTDVGKISLGVEIDAGDLAARLGEAVRRAIAPALAEIQRELQKTQREYDKTARAAAKSSAAQAEAANIAQRAIHNVGEEHTKTGAKTAAASGVSVRSINAVTRALEKQTAALIANTAARGANASAAPLGGGGTGGGGGGPPNRRSAVGDLFAGQGGGSRFLTSPVGINLVALGIGSLPAAATALTQVVGGVQQLAQAGLALPGIYGAAAASVGTLVLGFKGVGDAASQLSEALKTGDPKDLEKAKELLEDMSPAGVAFAETLAKLNRGPLLEFRKAIQERTLAGFDKDLQGLTDKALPRAESGMGKIADTWNKTLKTLTGAAGQERNLSLMDRILGNTAEGQSRANAAIEPLVHALGTITAAGTDVLPRLGDGLASAARRFDEWITKVDADGRLDKWINQGITGLRQLAESGLSLVKVVTNITKAAGADNGGFLKWLESATAKLRDLTGSASGQAAISKFFREGAAQAKQWLPILENLVELLGSVYEASKTWSGVLLPVLRGVTEVLTSMPGLLHGVLVGFLAWKSINTVTSLLGGLSRLSGVLDVLPGKAQKAGRGMGSVMGAIGSSRGVAGLGLLGGGILTQATTGQEDVAGQLIGALSTVGGGALTGAAIGSVIPGVGTAIGAVAGGTVGAAIAGINFLLAENKTAAEAAAAAEAARAEVLDRSRSAMQLNAQAMKTANDALAESGGAIDANVLGAVGDQITNITDRLGAAYDEDTLKGIATSLSNVGMTTEQMAATITGSQAQFDALTTRLTQMGPAGQIAAQQLASIRDNTLGAASNATAAAPLLQQLADDFGSVAQAQVAVQNAFAAIPTEVPINISMSGHDAVVEILRNIGVQIDHNRNGEIITKVPLSAETLRQLEAIGVKVQQNKDGTINVAINEQQYLDTLSKLGTLGDAYKQLFAGTPALPNVPVAPPGSKQNPYVIPPGGNPFAIPGGADGMVIPGYAPGHDIVNAVLAPGEGVLIPEAVRGLGGAAAVYAINSRFRSGLSKRYYADGGVHGGTGALPGPVGDTELGVLIQIRDLLAGKGGTANPIAATAANTATTATAAKDTANGGMGPFGTPLKKRGNPGYEMAAAALSALGADPEQWIGADPSTYVAPGTASLSGVGGGSMDLSRYAAALRAFATSGDLSTVAGLGLNANDPVITALTSARNKRKGGLADDEIAGLVDSVLGPGGYTGVLDETNSPLVKSLTRYRETLMKQAGIAPATSVALSSSSAKVSGASGLLPATAALADAVKAAFPSVTEIGGVRKDAHPDHPSGRALDIMIPGGTTRGGANPAGKMLGDQVWSWLMSTGIVDPNGSLWRTDTGGDHYNHIHARIAEGMENAAVQAGLMPGGVPGMTASAGLPGSAAGGTGTPVYVTNWPGGGGGLPGFAKDIIGAGLGAAGQAGTNVVGDIGSAITDAFTVSDANRLPNAELGQLIRERNPNALAAALGFNVQDFTRQGGAGGDVEKNAEAYDASGRLFSDTGALMDRTMTSLNAQLQAMREQLVDVITQVSDKLNDSALEPVLKAGVQSALESLKDSVSAAIGTAMGNAAAPPIADAVSSAVASLPIDSSGAGNVGTNAAGAVTGVLSQGFAFGGPVSGGTPGKDSVPALLMPGEYVLNTMDVARLGGIGAIDAMRSRGMRRFATGGGVNVNDTVGAEFFGVSEVPIIGTIVNLLVRVLLQVLGVTIEGRDTFNELTDEFRQFRGDSFKAFDAQGRLLNDTSALIDRSSTSEETAAAERIRILKIVIQALIKYIIEKVIVPITKAVANAAIQAGASAAGAAVNTQAPGAGGIVSSLISSAGQAGVDIAAEVGTDFALAISEQLINLVAEGLQGLAPDLMTNVFGGGLLAMLINPIGNLLTTILGGFMGSFAGLLGGTFGGASTLMPGMSFDSGGIAEGIGYLPKATMEDELVLSPTETDLFGRFVSALERGGFGGGGNRTEVHAPITVVGGGRESADEVQNRLLALMP